MRKWVVFVAIMVCFASKSAWPQVTFSNDHVGLLARCINASIITNDTKKEDQYLVFSCAGPEARALYDALAAYSKTEVKTDDTSLLRANARSFVTWQVKIGGIMDGRHGLCAQFIQDQSGHSTSGFRCELQIPIGPFLN
jgi:hypothetical protein